MGDGYGDTFNDITKIVVVDRTGRVNLVYWFNRSMQRHFLIQGARYEKRNNNE